MLGHTTHSRTAARGGAVLASAGALAVSFGVLTAPAAMAGPAPQAVERAYIHTLALNSVDVGADESDALKLGYLVCALDQIGGTPPAGTQALARLKPAGSVTT